MGLSRAKQDPSLKRATFPCNICRNLLSASFAELVEFTFLLINAQGIALQKNLLMSLRFSCPNAIATVALPTRAVVANVPSRCLSCKE